MASFFCADGRWCQLVKEHVEECIKYLCKNYCDWGKKSCQTMITHDEECDVLHCTSPSPPSPSGSSFSAVDIALAGLGSFLLLAAIVVAVFCILKCRGPVTVGEYRREPLVEAEDAAQATLTLGGGQVLANLAERARRLQLLLRGEGSSTSSTVRNIFILLK